eukprot:2790699-Amphidinium_carterae.1
MEDVRRDTTPIYDDAFVVHEGYQVRGERLCELAPTDDPQHEAQLHQQAFYPKEIHMTTRGLQDRIDYLRNELKRHAGWFLRRNIDDQYQISGDKIARSTTHNIDIAQYMEIRTTSKQTKVKLISNKAEYKSRHVHDFSIITTDHDLNEDYAIQMIRHDTKASNNATILTYLPTNNVSSSL